MTPTLNASITPPFAEKHPHKITQHGRIRVDDYFWLKDPNWQAVMSAPDTRASITTRSPLTLPHSLTLFLRK
jgi:protease II